MTGIGTDLVHIPRIKKIFDRFGDLFLDKILSGEEKILFFQLENTRAIAFLAKRFAAKEAVAKALSTGIGSQVAFKEISISNLPNGKPEVILKGKAHSLGLNKEIHISISDEKEYALAFAMVSEA